MQVSADRPSTAPRLSRVKGQDAEEAAGEVCSMAVTCEGGEGMHGPFVLFPASTFALEFIHESPLPENKLPVAFTFPCCPCCSLGRPRAVAVQHLLHCWPRHGSGADGGVPLPHAPHAGKLIGSWNFLELMVRGVPTHSCMGARPTSTETNLAY